MDARKRFVLIVIASTLLSVLALAAFNIYIDQSRVLHRDLVHAYVHEGPNGSTWRPAPNRRYLKTLFLLENPQRFDSLVMGSSRASTMDMRLLGPNWYKYNFEYGMPQDHYQHLQVLLNHGMHIRHVILGLDHFSFYVKYPINHVLYYPYPLTTAEHINLFKSYLFKSPHTIDWDILFGRAWLVTDPHSPMDDGPMQWTATEEAAWRANTRHEQQLLDDTPFPGTLQYTTLHLQEAMDTLKAIQALCRQHGIQLTLYMQPFHYKNYLAMNQDEMDTIFAAVAALQPFYDFSGLNAYTLDNYYWKETSHFIEPVNSDIARILSGQAPPREDFGFLVTPANAAAHRAAQKQLIHDKLPALLAYDKHIILHPTAAALR